MLFQNKEVLKETEKPWKPSVSGIMGFLFGPMGGGIVAYLILKRIGRSEKANITLMISFLATLALFVFLLELPDVLAEEMGKFLGNILAPFIFPAILNKDFKLWQENNPDAQPRNAWASLPWGGLGLIISLVMLFGWDYDTNGANPFADYGSKRVFNSGEIYNSDNIQPEVVEKLGDALIVEGFFDGSQKSVQLQKNENGYILKLIVIDAAINDSALEPLFQEFGTNISKNTLGNQLIEIHLANAYFKTLKIIKVENDN